MPSSRPAMSFTAEIVENVAALAAADRDAWDELALASERPFCAPGWLLPWWRHVPPADAGLRLTLVRESGSTALVGVAPYFEHVRRGRPSCWRPLGAETCERVEPLARPGSEREVAAAVAGAMALRRPAAVTFEGIPASSPWPELLRDAWPGARLPTLQSPMLMSALLIGLQERDFDAWYSSKTSHFRQRLRRNQKELVKRGGASRLATDETIGDDLGSFIRLHRARRMGQGEQTSVTPAVERMLVDVGRELGVGDRLRVWSMEIGDATIASSVVLVAGAEIGYWLNGFDEGYASISPSRLGILNVVEDAFALGGRRLDLGAGAYEYKRRFADQEEVLQWRALVPFGPRAPLTLVQLATPRLRKAVSARIDPAVRAKLRRLVLRPGPGADQPPAAPGDPAP